MTEEGILISIRPHWTELIINQHKRIEIRKNLPHLAVPFTVYVYCTLNGQEKWLPCKKRNISSSSRSCSQQ